MAQRKNQSLSSNRAGSSSKKSTENKSSDEIRRDIDQTRAEMDETVDQIEERLRPRHLLDDLLDYVGVSRDQSAGQTAGQVSSVAKEAWSKISRHLQRHPISATLIGAGLTWMLVDEATDKDLEPRYTGRRIGGRGPQGQWRDDDLAEYSGSYVDARTGKPYDLEHYGDGSSRRSMAGGTARGSGAAATAGQANSGPGMTEKARQMAGSASQKASGAVDRLKDSTSDAADSAGDMASRARDTVAEYGRDALDRAANAQQRLVHGARHQGESVRRSVMDAADQYPLAVGAAALALGVVAGLILPGTRREDELMGEQSDRVADQARSVGMQAMRRGKEAVRETASAVEDEARREGLDPDTLGKKASNVAAETKEAAHREGVDPGSLADKAKKVFDRAAETAKTQARDSTDDLKRQAGERAGA